MLIRLGLALALAGIGVSTGQAGGVCDAPGAPRPLQACLEIEKAKVANMEGETRDALDHLRRALAMEDLTNDAAATALGQMATTYAVAGDIERSLSSLQSALQFLPNDVWLLMRSCQAHTAAGYVAKAQRDCARVRKLLRRERDPEARTQIEEYVEFAEARLALAKRQPTRSLKRIETLSKRSNRSISDPYLGILKGDAHAAAGQRAAAIAAYSNVIDSPAPLPSDMRAQVLFNRGLERLEDGGVDDALGDIEAAASLAPQAQYLYALCSINLRQGQSEAAVSACERLIGIAPDNHVHLDAYGLALLRNDRPQEAVKAFAHALRLSPQSKLSYAHLKEALGHLDGRLRIEDVLPDSVRALYGE
ncbi:lipopolysaccharide assembly protein LapB [Thalassococcus sp. S3]|uniref:tetratricopeptide repeat protein n=1 Tax=Thalassococcus sp. S3 TaxID=2017482 RepID=UPI00102458DD|nr:tetratricopeptide repeat protein [Thalassococcus sp. S3]QBF32202.1 hypothetical protein CFI11_13380 [Thalassococcus sp. S3]